VGKVVVMLGIVALLGAAFARPRGAPTLEDSPVIVRTSGITLVWPRQPSASQRFVVEMFRKRRLVHAESVRSDHLDVPGWLARGRYTWSVRAAGGSGAPLGSGRALEHGWFVISR
jgi:hypothetical protein